MQRAEEKSVRARLQDQQSMHLKEMEWHITEDNDQMAPLTSQYATIIYNSCFRYRILPLSTHGRKSFKGRNPPIETWSKDIAHKLKQAEKQKDELYQAQQLIKAQLNRKQESDQ